MRERTPMDSPARIFAVTGDAVARFRLDDPKPEFALEGYQVCCIAIDPRDSKRVYVGTMDSGLWFSTDGGASWREAGPSIDEPRVLSVAVSVRRARWRVGRLRRHRTQQPLSVRGRRTQLATAASSPRAAERVELVIPAAPMDAPRPHDRASPDRPGMAR